MQKKPAFVPDSEAFNSSIGDGFPVPELKGECEASGYMLLRPMLLRPNAT